MQILMVSLAYGLALVFMLATWVHVTNIKRVEGVLHKLGVHPFFARLSALSGATITAMLFLAPQVGGILAACYLTITTSMFALAIMRGAEIPDCGCFPRRSSVDRGFLVRNMVLIVTAATVAVFGPLGSPVIASILAAISVTLTLIAISVRSREERPVKSSIPQPIDSDRRRLIRVAAATAVTLIAGAWAPLVRAQGGGENRRKRPTETRRRMADPELRGRLEDLGSRNLPGVLRNHGFDMHIRYRDGFGGLVELTNSVDLALTYSFISAPLIDNGGTRVGEVRLFSGTVDMLPDDIEVVEFETRPQVAINRENQVDLYVVEGNELVFVESQLSGLQRAAESLNVECDLCGPQTCWDAYQFGCLTGCICRVKECCRQWCYGCCCKICINDPWYLCFVGCCDPWCTTC